MATTTHQSYPRMLGLKNDDPHALHLQVEDGLPYETLERLQEVLDLPVTELADLIRVPHRTIARRKTAGRLHPDESDRLLRLARLVGLTLGLFEGDLPAARAWLSTPNRALGNERPLWFATTDVGAREIEQLIGRVEHGIPL